MTINELKRRKEELGYSYKIISALSGVSIEFVEELFSEDKSSSIAYEDRQAIERVLKEPDPSEVGETSALYLAKKQGEFTLEDYYALPDDVRVELIDGVVYDMSSPLFSHQHMVFEIAVVLREFIKKKNGKCKVAISPLDVQLDCDEKTMVQPDIVILCDKNKIMKHGIYGAPDFVVEVLSPSTRKKDMTIKLSKYMNAGVREYWIVDIEKQRVLVYNWEQDDVLSIYGFHDKVQVGIFEGNCEVDFTRIYEDIA